MVETDQGKAAVGTVSGYIYLLVVRLHFDASTHGMEDAVFDSNINKVVIFYKDTGNSDYGKFVCGTVSGTSISFDTAVVYHSASCCPSLRI